MSKKNENNTKKGNALTVVVVIVLIIAIALILLGLFGKGFGFGNGNGDGTGTGVSDSAESSENSGGQADVTETSAVTEQITTTTTESTEPEASYMDVTVSGGAFLIDGAEVMIDEIKYSAENGNVIVRITDDNAIADSMDALVSALDTAGLQYVLN